MSECQDVKQIDLCLYRGDTHVIEAIYTDADGNPVDVTGYTAKLQIREKPGDADPPLVALTESAGIVVDEPNGKFTATLSSQNTGSDLDAYKSAAYDLEITSPAGVVTTLQYGGLTFTTDVSR